MQDQANENLMSKQMQSTYEIFGIFTTVFTILSGLEFGVYLAHKKVAPSPFALLLSLFLIKI